MSKFILVILAGFIILLPGAVSAQVLINEIAWMGTTVSATYEWLELYNSADQPVNLQGWVLKAADGTPRINVSGEIAAGGYFLLERTDDQTVPAITADQIFSGAIGNTGEDFQLFDAGGNLIDEASFASGWPGGDNTTKQTLERSTIDNWQTSLQPDGTPRAKNSTAPAEPQEPPMPECPQTPECPVIPECPAIPECPQIPECPPTPDLNTAIEVSTDEIPNLIDGQKIKIRGLITKRPLVFLSHVLMIDNLKILILDAFHPRLRLKSNIEATGRLLQTPIGPILIVYQISDIKVTN